MDGVQYPALDEVQRLRRDFMNSRHLEVDDVLKGSEADNMGIIWTREEWVRQRDRARLCHKENLKSIDCFCQGTFCYHF